MAGNTTMLLAARIVTSLAGVATLPVVYGRLGARSYGVWALLAGMVAVFSLADLGLGSTQIREVARTAGGGSRRRARAVLGLGAVWGAGLGALALAGTVICWPWLAQLCRLGTLASQARNAALILLVGLVLDGVSMPWRSVLEGTQHYAAVARIAVVTSLTGSGLAVAVIELGGGLVALAGSAVTASALRALLLVRAAGRESPGLGPGLGCIRRCDVVYAAAYGSRVQAANAAAAVNGEMDRLALAAFFGPLAVAGFDLGSRLVGLLRLPSGIVSTALFPGAVAVADEPGRLDRLYLAMTRYLAVFAATGAAVLLVSADPLVRLWLGHPVPSTTQTIVILAPGYAAAVIASAAAVVTRAEGRPGRETRGGVLAAALNLLLTFPLLGLLGPAGVPLATTLAAFVATAYFFAHFHRASGRPVVPLLGALWPPALAAGAAGAITWRVASELPAGTGRISAALAVAWEGTLTVVLVAAALALLGFFDAADRSRLRAVVSLLSPRRIVAPATQGRS